MYLKKYIIKNETWAIIPARSASKRVKNKNIVDINGFPLISYSITISKQIKEIKKTFVTTDSKKIKKISEKYGAEVPYLRSKKISGDKSVDKEYFDEFINFFVKKKYLPEFIIQLRPTTPFRDTLVLKKALKLLHSKKNYTSLRSSSISSHPVEKLFRIKNNTYTDINYKKTNENIFNKSGQLFEKTYKPNGYVDIIRTKNLFSSKLYGNKILPFLTSNTLDIDTPEDLQICRSISNEYKKRIISQMIKLS